MSKKSQTVVVVGAGVIGLSCALELQKAGYAVTILAKDFPVPFALVDTQTHINYTSPWGGAHNRWVPPPLPRSPTSSPSSSPSQGQGQKQDEEEEDHNIRDHKLALTTFHGMQQLFDTASSSTPTGITFMKGIEHLESPPEEYLALANRSTHPIHNRYHNAAALGIKGFRVLEKDELPLDGKVKLGFEYDTWCVNPMVYCSFLLNRFVYRGGKVVKGEIRDLREVFLLDLGGIKTETVVNASGQGFGDERMFITRGQTCLVANTAPSTITRQNADGTWSFCIPRNYEGGTIIGGTKEPNNWDVEPSPQVRERLVRAFVATYPDIMKNDEFAADSQAVNGKGSVRVLKDIVGRRPTRHGGARIDRENVSVDDGKKKVIVHAYGLGGRGFEMSWGVAEMVAGLVGQSSSTTARL